MFYLWGGKQILAGNPEGDIRTLCQPGLQLTTWLLASMSVPAVALITRGSQAGLERAGEEPLAQGLQERLSAMAPSFRDKEEWELHRGLSFIYKHATESSSPHFPTLETPPLSPGRRKAWAHLPAQLGGGGTQVHLQLRPGRAPLSWVLQQRRGVPGDSRGSVLLLQVASPQGFSQGARGWASDQIGVNGGTLAGRAWMVNGEVSEGTR